MTRCRSLISVLLLAGCFVCAASAPVPEHLLGMYVHKSNTCGGPSSADDQRLVNCGLVFDDELHISKPTHPEHGSVGIIFSFHFGYGDYCKFEGDGNWQREVLVLASARTKTLAPCRLSLHVEDSAVRIVDPKDACRPALCVAPGPSLDGLVFKRAR